MFKKNNFKFVTIVLLPPYIPDLKEKVKNTLNNSDDVAEIFSAHFREHEARLYLLAYRLTKSDQLAQDIVQEVFLKLWQQMDTIDEINDIEAWLYRLTENKVIDFLRKAAADNRLKEAIWHNLQDIANDSTFYLEAKECNAIIQRAIDQLPLQRKIIYRLNREKGLNYNEIATNLHISRHTVKNQLSSALIFLRKVLKQTATFF